jgi:hypothetical protein
MVTRWHSWKVTKTKQKLSFVFIVFVILWLGSAYSNQDQMAPFCFHIGTDYPSEARNLICESIRLSIVYCWENHSWKTEHPLGHDHDE